MESPYGTVFAPTQGTRRIELPDRTVEIHSLGENFPALTPEGEVLSTLRVRSSSEADAGRLQDLTVPLHISVPGVQVPSTLDDHPSDPAEMNARRLWWKSLENPQSLTHERFERLDAVDVSHEHDGQGVRFCWNSMFRSAVSSTSKEPAA